MASRIAISTAIGLAVGTAMLVLDGTPSAAVGFGALAGLQALAVRWERER